MTNIDHDALARRITERLAVNGFISVPGYCTGQEAMEVVTKCIVFALREALPTSEPSFHAMVLVYQPELTHSVWQDAYFEDARGMRLATDELIEKLKHGVRDGEWVAWRLVSIEREVMGNVD